MKIALIGSGNIATFFGSKFLAAGHEIIQVISPNASHAGALARALNCTHATNLSQLNHQAEVILLAVKDDITVQLAKDYDFGSRLVIHTAGSVTLEQIGHASKHVGSMWCVYSINKHYLPDRGDIPIIINASDTKSMAQVEILGRCITNSIFTLTDEHKTIAHLAAVYANNFTNHLFTISQSILQEHQIPFALLIPLIENTIDKLHYSEPDKLQTGPAIRHDEVTIEKHLQILTSHEIRKAIYVLLTKSIQSE
jgi:predicted short-subunit dehydrogenase-like oxidoreductase (DUF2520 family)